MMEYLDSLDKAVEQIEFNMMKLLWGMRGSITLEEAYQMTRSEIEQASRVIKENYEISKKINQPHW